jgi:hypothetical protein
MLVLKISAALALLVEVLKMTDRFQTHCKKKFGVKAVDPESVCLWQLYAVIAGAGWLWMTWAARAHGDMLNGLLVMAAAFLWAGWLVVINLRQFGPFYGIAATSLQLLLAAVLIPPFSHMWLVGDRFANRDFRGGQKQRRDDNKAGLSGYRPLG